MTRDEILAMKPGRELDALVIEEVLGYEPKEFHSSRGVTFAWGRGETLRHEGWSPSTDISAAWEVVEKNGKNAFEVGRSGERFLRKWTARFGMMNDWAEADTAPLAICRAALLAVMGA